MLQLWSMLYAERIIDGALSHPHEPKLGCSFLHRHQTGKLMTREVRVPEWRYLYVNGFGVMLRLLLGKVGNCLNMKIVCRLPSTSILYQQLFHTWSKTISPCLKPHFLRLFVGCLRVICNNCDYITKSTLGHVKYFRKHVHSELPVEYQSQCRVEVPFWLFWTHKGLSLATTWSELFFVGPEKKDQHCVNILTKMLFERTDTLDVSQT